MQHRVARLALPIAAALLAAGSAALTTGASAAPPDSMPPGFARGEAALERIGDRLPDVANAYGLGAGQLRRAFLTDATLAVDGAGELAYFDEAEPGELAADPVAVGTDPPPAGNEFGLASRPGADKTIYLDFDGHVTQGTSWNSAYGVTTIDSPAYSQDRDTGTFNSQELQIIRESWAAVAEDFAPWNVNVTTIDPGAEALRRSGAGDTQWGARVVITADTFANCGCGGHAYVGAFDDSQDEPTFVYNTSFVGVAEAISHEVGHMLLLQHDGLTSGGTYYTGHSASGTPSWGPIMGAGYDVAVTHWSGPQYYLANNGQDDIAIIGGFGNGNDFGLRADDHGDDLASATGMFTQQVSIEGVVETADDVDVFSFSTAQGADVSFVVEVAAIRPNLDVELTMRDSAGNVIARDNGASVLSAGFDANVAPGTYTVEVDGVGVGDPAANPPSGYTDEGSLGQYTLLGYISDAEPPDTTPPAAPTGVSATASNGSAIVSWEPNVDADLAGYVVQRATGGGFTDLATLGAVLQYPDSTAPGGDVDYRVIAVDTSDNRSAPSAPVTVTIPIDLSQRATGETVVDGSVSGTYQATLTRGDGAQTITEIESGGKPSNRHDRAEHRWTIPASQGNQTLTVVASATDGGDDDDGFLLEWSDDGSMWLPVVRVRSGSPVDDTFDIGAPTGTIQVRVIDTDRSRGQRSFDSVSVDFLEVNGDGNVVEQPTASVAVASISVSQQGAGRGQQYGVATVQVRDNLGAPIANASVTVQFDGSFGGQLRSGTTGDDGSITLITSAPVRKPTFTACVSSVTSSLPYAPGTESC